jgi:hypothetical protein
MEFEDVRKLVLMSNQAQTRLQANIELFSSMISQRDAEIVECRRDLEVTMWKGERIQLPPCLHPFPPPTCHALFPPTWHPCHSPCTLLLSMVGIRRIL